MFIVFRIMCKNFKSIQPWWTWVLHDSNSLSLGNVVPFYLFYNHGSINMSSS